MLIGVQPHAYYAEILINLAKCTGEKGMRDCNHVDYNRRLIEHMEYMENKPLCMKDECTDQDEEFVSDSMRLPTIEHVSQES